jgi:peptide/nickel transport system permease protein
MDITPGDAVDMMLPADATEEARVQLRQELGLDKPFLQRYINFIMNAVRGDFGRSYRTGRPVFQEIWHRYPATVKLAFSSIILATIIGVPIGVLSAVKQYSLLDNISSFAAMFLASIPAFWLGLMMILLFSLKLDLLPSHGLDNWTSYILPTVSIALPSSARILRLTRSAMLETIRQDYIRTARAKGASERIVIFKHALKNALLPIITMIGVQFSILIGGTVVAETVYSLPGLGSLVVTSIRSKDTPQIMGAIILISTLSCTIVLIVDILYSLIDPRIKARYAKKGRVENA